MTTDLYCNWLLLCSLWIVH